MPSAVTGHCPMQVSPTNSAVCCRHRCSQGSEISHYQGPAPNTPGKTSNALGWQAQQRSPSCLVMTQAGGSPPQHLLPASTGEKAEDHLPQEFRYLIWKGNRMAHKLLGRHPKQNKKPKPFCAAPPALLQTPQLGSGCLLCPGCVRNPWVKLLNH